MTAVPLRRDFDAAALVLLRTRPRARRRRDDFTRSPRFDGSMRTEARRRYPTAGEYRRNDRQERHEGPSLDSTFP